MASGAMGTLLPSMAPGQGIFATLGPSDVAQLQMGGKSPGGSSSPSPSNAKVLLHKSSNRQMLIDKMQQATFVVCSGKRDCACRQCTAQMQAQKDQVYHIGVPKAHLHEWATEKYSEQKSCLGASYYIFALFVFSIFLGMRTDVEGSRGVDQAFRSFLLEKVEFDDPPETLQDVVTIEDFYSWLRLGLIPALHPETKFVSQKPLEDPTKYGNHSDATPIKGNFLRFNTILGGFIIYQHYNTKLACSNIPDAMLRFGTQRECYPDQSIPLDWYNEILTLYIDYADTVPGWLSFGPQYQRTGRTERDNALSALDIEKGVTIGKTRYFHYGMTPEQMDTEAQVMEFGNASLKPWITQGTRQIVVSFLSFNTELGMWTMTRIDFFINRAGKIQKLITNSFAKVITYAAGSQGVLLHAFEMAWAVLCVLPIVFQLIRFIIKTVRKAKGKTSPAQHYGPCAWVTLHLIRFFKTFLGNMDFVCFVFAFGLFLCFRVQASRLDAAVEALKSNANLVRNDEMTEDGLASWFAFHDTYLDLDTGMWSHSDSLRSFCAIYVITVLAMILRQFHRHPRLSFVTRTLTAISWDLFHFLVVTSIVLFSFTLAAQALYGSKDRSFSSFFRACGALFRVTFGADSWNTLVNAGYFSFTSVLFYGSYYLILILLLLNMVLAMVMDSYAEIQRTSGIRKHIISSTWELIVHELNAIRGHATGFSTILRELKTMGKKTSAVETEFDRFNLSETRRNSNTDEDLITVDVLQFSFPKMRPGEAEHMLMSVVKDQDEKRKAHAGVNLWKEVFEIREAVQILLQSGLNSSMSRGRAASVADFRSMPNLHDEPEFQENSSSLKNESSNALPSKKPKKDRLPRKKADAFHDFDLTKKAAFKWRPSTTSPESLGRTVRRIRQKEEEAQRRNVAMGVSSAELKLDKKLKKEKKERELGYSPRSDQRQLMRAHSDLPRIKGPARHDK